MKETKEEINSLFSNISSFFNKDIEIIKDHFFFHNDFYFKEENILFKNSIDSLKEKLIIFNPDFKEYQFIKYYFGILNYFSNLFKKDVITLNIEMEEIFFIKKVKTIKLLLNFHI